MIGSEREIDVDVTHGWIQWKGTDVCMDVYCKCGQHYHIDGYFCYYVKCPKCNAIFKCNGNVELVELTKEEQDQVAKEHNSVIKTDAHRENELEIFSEEKNILPDFYDKYNCPDLKIPSLVKRLIEGKG